MYLTEASQCLDTMLALIQQKGQRTSDLKAAL